MDAKDWASEFEKIRKIIQLKRQSYSIFDERERQKISGCIGALESQLKAMMIAPMEYEVCLSELNRRNFLLLSVQKNFSQIVRRNGNVSSSSKSAITRSDLMGTLGDSSDGRGYNKYVAISPNKSSVVSERGLLEKQEQVIKLQDGMLEDISKGVDNLKQKAHIIGEEAKIHVRLLDDLDGNVELATAGLQNETRHAETIRAKSRMCYMYICVFVEIIVLLILAIVAFTR